MSGNIPGYILALKNRNKRRSGQENRAQAVMDFQENEKDIYSTNNMDIYNDSEHFSQKKRRSKRSLNSINNDSYRNKPVNEQNFDSPSYQTRFSAPESQISIPADEFTEEEIKPRNRNNISDFDEISELRQTNRDLQNEIHDLENEVQRLQNQLKQRESEIPEDFQFAIQTQKDINAQLQAQLDKAQNRISQLEQVISIKEDSIQKMTSEFQAASATLKDHMDIMSSQSSQLEQANNQILSLKIELERYKRNQETNLFQKRLSFDPDDSANIRAAPNSYQDILPFTRSENYNNNYNMNTQSDPNSPSNYNYKPYQPRSQFQPAFQNSNGSPTNIMNQYQPNNFANHPAMRDNLKFGDDQPPPPLEFNVETMADDEIREKFNEYSKIKADIEWKLNRAPPKAANMSHARVEREKMEEEADQLHRKISKLKYEMKKRHIF